MKEARLCENMDVCKCACVTALSVKLHKIGLGSTEER